VRVVAGLFLLPESKLSKEKSHSWDIPSTILSIAGMLHTSPIMPAIDKIVEGISHE
jgi:hypothetical protein